MNFIFRQQIKASQQEDLTAELWWRDGWVFPHHPRTPDITKKAHPSIPSSSLFAQSEGELLRQEESFLRREHSGGFVLERNEKDKKLKSLHKGGKEKEYYTTD